MTARYVSRRRQRRRWPWWVWRYAAPLAIVLAVLAVEAVLPHLRRIDVPNWFGNVGITLAPASPLVGRASVIDGDTIEIHGERIRFNGIDAPESNQSCRDASGQDYRCGLIAAQVLDGFLAKSAPTRCDFVERDQYDRFVGNCFRADGISVAASLVRAGMAMDWPRYSNGFYAEEQEAAKTERVGLWSGSFQPPWEWRAEQRDDAPQAPTFAPAPLLSVKPQVSGGGCDIKGNVSSKGERIYHVPGQKFYAETRITTSKGERFFCSEAEARSAGWRRARR